jgi:GxxExxY protein
MPITSPVDFPRLSSDEFRELDYGVMRHAFASHRTLGRLADESVYQADFAARLAAAGHTVHREVPVTASFRGFTKTYYLDMVIDGMAVYELKTVISLAAEHEAQVINYLLMVDSPHGKLINFRSRVCGVALHQCAGDGQSAAGLHRR